GGDAAPFPQGREVDLFLRLDTTPTRLLAAEGLVGQSRHRFHLEMEGARTQAQDWLRDAGFSLLEERDLEGRRSYQVVSSAPPDDFNLRVHARLGLPQLSAGLRPRREVPAIGAMIPWQGYAFELEALSDRTLGWELMGRARWSSS